MIRLPHANRLTPMILAITLAQSGAVAAERIAAPSAASS